MFETIKNFGAKIGKKTGIAVASTAALLAGTGGTNGGINLIKKETGIKINGKLQLGMSLISGTVLAASTAIGLSKKSCKCEKHAEESVEIEDDNE